MLGPVPLGVTVLTVVGWSSDGVAGAGWGVLAGVFVAVLPYVVTNSLRRPDEEGRRRRSARVRYLLVTLCSALVGVVLTGVGAPHEVFAVTLTIVVGLVAAVVVNVWLPVSNHASAAAGAVAMLTVLFGPSALMLVPLVAAVAWARVELGRHTIGEVATGVVVGGLSSTVCLGVLL